MEKKSNVWDINFRVLSRWRVCFEEELTHEEALEAASHGEWDDVIDQEDLSWEVVD